MTVLRAILFFLASASVASLVAGGYWARLRRETPKAVTTPRPPPPPPVVHAEGRVATPAGATVAVGAEAVGTLEKVLVNEGDVVQAGDLLATIRATEQSASLSEAHARASEANASLKFIATEAQRIRALVASGAMPRQALDKLTHDRSVARAQRASAYAAAARASGALQQRRIVAPIAGTIVARAASAGETLAPGAPIVTIADLSKLRVEAEVDEFDALRIAPGMRAEVSADGAPAPFAGSVSEVPAIVVPRKLRAQDPARPTDAHVLVVKVALEGAGPLKLGQRVRVRLLSPPGPQS